MRGQHGSVGNMLRAMNGFSARLRARTHGYRFGQGPSNRALRFEVIVTWGRLLGVITQLSPEVSATEWSPFFRPAQYRRNASSGPDSVWSLYSATVLIFSEEALSAHHSMLKETDMDFSKPPRGMATPYFPAENAAPAEENVPAGADWFAWDLTIGRADSSGHSSPNPMSPDQSDSMPSILASTLHWGVSIERK